MTEFKYIKEEYQFKEKLLMAKNPEIKTEMTLLEIAHQLKRNADSMEIVAKETTKINKRLKTIGGI